MRQLAVALLATTMIGTAAFAAGPQQPPAGQNHQNQMQGNQQMQKPEANQQNNNNQQAQNNNQPISVQNLSHKEIRQVQQALNKNGDKVGPTDGRWGPKTENALKRFEQGKNIRANGELDRQTVASLGLNTSKFAQAQAK
jgi:hypothetical protein